MTMTPNVVAMATYPEEKPYSKMRAVISELTAAEWELGIPPVVVMIDKEVFLPFIKRATGYLMSCVKKMAAIEHIKGKFIKIIIQVLPLIVLVDSCSYHNMILIAHTSEHFMFFICGLFSPHPFLDL